MMTVVKAAIALAILGGQPGDVLKRDLKVGESNEYEIKCTRSVGSEDGSFEPHDFTATWKATYKVDSVDPEKGAALTVAIKDFSISGSVQMPEAPPKEKTIQATLSEKNEIKPKSADPKDTTTSGWLLADSIELPNKEVKVGDAWEITLPENSVVGTKQKLEAKLTGEQEYEGLKAWVVTVQKDKIDYKQQVKVAIGDPSNTKDATMSGSAKLNITALIEKGTGRVLSLTEKAHANQQLEMEGIEQPPLVVDYAATVKLKVPKG